MIKTKLVSITVIVGDRELRIGDKVKMETITKNDGHNNIYEIVGIIKGAEGVKKNYYELRRKDGSKLTVEATWFDNPTRKTYLIVK